MNLLQQVDWNDIDSIKNYYIDLPRTLKRVPKHLFGISTELSDVDKAIKWFSGLNAMDQRKQAEYWNEVFVPPLPSLPPPIHILSRRRRTTITTTTGEVRFAQSVKREKERKKEREREREIGLKRTAN